jgi:hypothetical protein
MNADSSELERRTVVALAAIKRALEDDEDSPVVLFASHHIAELGEAYWMKHVGTPRPSAKQVVTLLALSSHWNDEEDEGADEEDEGVEVLDFTLPDDVTNYLLSVRFDDSGEVASIEMES